MVKYDVVSIASRALILCLPLLIFIYIIRNTFVVYYVCLINIITIACYGYDKYISSISSPGSSGYSRIPEKVLRILAFIGAYPAAYIGQQMLRHKSGKQS